MKTQYRIMFSLLTVFSFCNAKAAISEKEKLADFTAKQLDRAHEFKQSIQTDKGYSSGVYVYSKRSVKDYEHEPDKLAARLSVLGFTDVYVSCDQAFVNDENSKLSWQKTFISAAHKWGMKVHSLRLSSAKLFVSDQRIKDECNSVMDYNQSVAANERFDGVSADLEPHILKKTFADRPQGLTLTWDSKENMGIGKDNDLLLKRTVNVLEKAQKEIKPLVLSEAIGFFVQSRVNDGLVEHGGAAEFLKFCNSIIVMAYNKDMKRIWEMSKPAILAAGNKPKSVSIAIKTSLGTFGDGGVTTSLQPGGWANLINTMNFLFNKYSEFQSFNGIDIFEFQGLEKMLNAD